MQRPDLAASRPDAVPSLPLPCQGGAAGEAAMEMLFGSLFARRLIGAEGGGWPETVVDTLLRGLAR